MTTHFSYVRNLVKTKDVTVKRGLLGKRRGQVGRGRGDNGG
jgi:hypothetical protein